MRAALASRAPVMKATLPSSFPAIVRSFLISQCQSRGVKVMWRVAEPTHDERGFVGVAAVLGRAVVLLGIVMSDIRSRIRFSEMRPSARASGAPGQEWTPRMKAICSRTLARSVWNVLGSRTFAHHGCMRPEVP